MTVGCNIFRDKTTMPGSERDEMDDVTRVHQVTNSPKGAQVAQRLGPQGMNVEHAERPRRGHDY